MFCFSISLYINNFMKMIKFFFIKLIVITVTIVSCYGCGVHKKKRCADCPRFSSVNSSVAPHI